MAKWCYGLVFSLALIVTAADECRDRHESIDFPLKYVTAPDDKPLDWDDASKQCRLQHPGYDLLERRYLWLSEQQKAPCKDLLVPLGLMKYNTIYEDVVIWQRLPPGLDMIRPTDMSNYRQEQNLTAKEYCGALNLTDGSWHWMVYKSPIFTCVICQHNDNYSMITNDYERHACFWRDSWIDKTVYQITLQRVAGGDYIDDYRIEEAVACAFNLTVDFVVILEDHQENRRQVMVNLALNGTVDTQQYLSRVLDGYNLTNILEVDKLKLCQEGNQKRFFWPYIIPGANTMYERVKHFLHCISTIVPRMVELLSL